jgi:hypothetical protein
MDWLLRPFLLAARRHLLEKKRKKRAGGLPLLLGAWESDGRSGKRAVEAGLFLSHASSLLEAIVLNVAVIGLWTVAGELPQGAVPHTPQKKEVGYGNRVMIGCCSAGVEELILTRVQVSHRLRATANLLDELCVHVDD